MLKVKYEVIFKFDDCLVIILKFLVVDLYIVYKKYDLRGRLLFGLFFFFFNSFKFKLVIREFLSV